MINPILLIDTYEYGGEINENILLQNDVRGIIIRLNNMNGGHHMDFKFLEYWKKFSVLFVCIPYFVYNPWVTGQQNYEWMKANIPLECNSVMVDVEVKYSGYSPNTYASELNKFYNLISPKYNYMIYTGEGYLDISSSWPKDKNYWWAQYPSEFYVSQNLTWNQLKEKLINYDKPYNESKVPGNLKMWQFTGDKLILPGCDKPLDVNIFYGTLDELKSFENRTTQIPPVENNDKHYTPYVGVDVYEIIRFNAKCYIHIVDPTKARIFVTPGQFQTVSGALNKYGADIGLNGGGWPVDQTIRRSNELWASNGKIINSNVLDNRGYINVNGNGVLSISENSKLLPDIYNAWGFDRILGKNGVFNSKITDKTRDARTGYGITADNKLVALSCEGNDYYNKGLTFREMWEVFKEFGSTIAGNADGGSSSAVINKALSDTSLISPSEGSEANVINHVLIFSNPIIEDEDTGEKTMFFKVKTVANKRKTPSMYETVTSAGFPVGTVIETPATIKDSDTRSNAIFVKTSDNWYQPVSYNGVTYMEVISSPTEPEEPPVPFPADAKNLTFNVEGIVLGKVIINGEEWIRKI